MQRFYPDAMPQCQRSWVDSLEFLNQRHEISLPACLGATRDLHICGHLAQDFDRDADELAIHLNGSTPGQCRSPQGWWRVEEAWPRSWDEFARGCHGFAAE